MGFAPFKTGISVQRALNFGVFLLYPQEKSRLKCANRVKKRKIVLLQEIQEAVKSGLSGR